MGYRTENLYGEGYRDPLAVITYEICNLNNFDIPTTLFNTVLKDTPIASKLKNLVYCNKPTPEEEVKNLIKESIQYIESIYNKKLTYVLWLCDSKEELITSYYYNDSDETICIDEYEDGFVVLSDIGINGKLYGYSEKPEVIKTESVQIGEFNSTYYQGALDFANYCWLHGFDFSVMKAGRPIRKRVEEFRKDRENNDRF